jgi:hypothetical protein
MSDHSKSVWATETTFLQSIQRLREQFDDEEPILSPMLAAKK